MASLGEQTLPVRDGPPLAGGGRPTAKVELQGVYSLSPTIQAYLKRIYSDLVADPRPPSSSSDEPPLSSLQDFEAWFRSPAAAALALPSKHNLSLPLSNYYISSSHNTYLSGNQVYGAASGDAYRNVLIRGCRCLEIDVWDGEDDDTSVSSSDLEGQHLAPKPKEHKNGSRRERANSAFSKFKHRVRDKAERKLSSSKSPVRSPHQDTSAVDGDTLAQLQRLKSEPRVYHGYTLTKDIPFRTVCQAIKDSAFEASDLPLIVSLEVHCCLEQQEIMVEIMRSVFQDHLIDITNDDAQAIDKLPSPDQLRKKILIKVKWTPAPDSDESNNPHDHVQQEEAKPENEAEVENLEKKKASKILQALSQLGVYTRAYSFKHFSQPEAKIPTHVFSLNEAKVEDMHADPEHGPALFEHNRDFLMRVFPAGYRVNSSNVEPCFLWRQGAQMVALNWQKIDRGTMLNEGMFAGEEGWVLKPDGFRSLNVKHDSGSTPSAEPRRCLLDLDIEVLAAQNLPLPIGKEASHLARMKPYVKIQLHVDTHGPPGLGSAGNSDKLAHTNSRYNARLGRHSSDASLDDEARRLKRKSKSARSSNPDFEAEPMQWKGIHDVVDELSFLRLKIMDERTIGKDELIAWACIKLSRLKTGYRLVHLLDAAGAPCDGALLVRISTMFHA